MYKEVKNQTTSSESILNQCFCLHFLAARPGCTLLPCLTPSIPPLASPGLPARLQWANLLRVRVVVLIISAQRHGHGLFSGTVQLTAN